MGRPQLSVSPTDDHDKYDENGVEGKFASFGRYIVTYHSDDMASIVYFLSTTKHYLVYLSEQISSIENGLISHALFSERKLPDPSIRLALNYTMSNEELDHVVEVLQRVGEAMAKRDYFGRQFVCLTVFGICN
ncbi:hypothetical protein ACTXT7_002432 [Hymenolepis weldensis]